MQSVRDLIASMRRMTVVRAPGTYATPMIKISNRMLVTAGFGIGTPIEVRYDRNIITVKVIDHEYQLQSPPSPFSLPTASVTSGKTGAGEVAEHARRAEPCAIDTSQVVPSPICPLRWILSGHYYNGDS